MSVIATSSVRRLNWYQRRLGLALTAGSAGCTSWGSWAWMWTRPKWA